MKLKTRLLILNKGKRKLRA